jgi:hypothetical protein
MSDKYRLLVFSLPNSPVIIPIPNLAKKNTPHPNEDLQLEFPPRLVRNPISWQVDAYRKLLHVKLVTL